MLDITVARLEKLLAILQYKIESLKEVKKFLDLFCFVLFCKTVFEEIILFVIEAKIGSPALPSGM